MKKLITLIVGITLISCSNDNNDCHNEKALASEYYSDLIEQSSEMQIELLEREFNRYIELKACDCMFFTNLKRIESKYNDLLSQAETAEEVNQLQLQRRSEIIEISHCRN